MKAGNPTYPRQEPPVPTLTPTAARCHAGQRLRLRRSRTGSNKNSCRLPPLLSFGQEAGGGPCCPPPSLRRTRRRSCRVKGMSNVRVGGKVHDSVRGALALQSQKKLCGLGELKRADELTSVGVGGCLHVYY